MSSNSEEIPSYVLTDKWQREFLSYNNYADEKIEELLQARVAAAAKLKELMAAMRAAGYTATFHIAYEGKWNEYFWHFDEHYINEEPREYRYMKEQPSLKFFENHPLYVLEESANQHSEEVKKIVDPSKFYVFDYCDKILSCSWPNCWMEEGCTATIALNLMHDRVQLEIVKFTDEEDENGDMVEDQDGQDYEWWF